MALVKVSFGNCIIFALALTEVTSWTIDLPEMRKFFFEKHAKEKVHNNYDKNDIRDEQVLYSNIEGNSEHNSKPYDDVYEYSNKRYGEKNDDYKDEQTTYSKIESKHNSRHYEDANEDIAYAREYGYQSYMEKKVEGIVYNGSVYLEGLRRSLETYSRILEDCNRMNSSRNGTAPSNSTVWRPPVESPLEALNSTNSTQRCRVATESSEHVRRLSELSMWATRELQDIAYARKYKKGDYHQQMQEENELILKLAWFLDRLAHYTGYEPDPKDFVRDKTRSTTSTTTLPPPLVTVPEDVKVAMMNCLKQNSSEPAVDRCRYPEPLPPVVQMMMEMNSNISGIPLMPTSDPTSEPNEQVLPIASESRTSPVSEQSMELLIASDYRTPLLNMHPNFAPISSVRNVQKRSVPSMPGPEVLESAPKYKMIEDDPAISFVKYYAKHKVWEGSNLNVVTKTNFEEYEVKNHISHTIKKRAIDKKFKHLRVPEDPFQDLTKYIKHKPGVNYIKDDAQAQKIKEAIEKMAHSKPLSSKNLLSKLTKTFRQKRSIKFEKDVDSPRESADPQGDISYYIKNKEGTNYNNNLQQAVQLRAGLQQVFNNPNIETVRRYGANYNPLIPAPFFAGLIQTQADF